MTWEEREQEACPDLEPGSKPLMKRALGGRAAARCEIEAAGGRKQITHKRTVQSVDASNTRLVRGWGFTKAQAGRGRVKRKTDPAVTVEPVFSGCRSLSASAHAPSAEQ